MGLMLYIEVAAFLMLQLSMKPPLLFMRCASIHTFLGGASGNR